MSSVTGRQCWAVIARLEQACYGVFRKDEDGASIRAALQDFPYQHVVNCRWFIIKFAFCRQALE